MPTHFSGPVDSTNGFVGGVSVESADTIELKTGSIVKLVSTSSTTTANDKIQKTVAITLTGVAATTGGAVGALLNPEGVPVIITRAILYKTVQSTGAATLDIGVGANVTTSSDILLDGITAQTTAIADNINDAGTNGKARQIWGATEAVTVTGSATTAGLVGKLFVTYIIP